MLNDSIYKGKHTMSSVPQSTCVAIYREAMDLDPASHCTLLLLRVWPQNIHLPLAFDLPKSKVYFVQIKTTQSKTTVLSMQYTTWPNQWIQDHGIDYDPFISLTLKTQAPVSFQFLYKQIVQILFTQMSKQTMPLFKSSCRYWKSKIKTKCWNTHKLVPMERERTNISL